MWGWQERPDTANSQLAAASDGNCRCSEPSCKSSPHWQRGTHFSPRECGAGKKDQTLPTVSWLLPVLAAASEGNCKCSEPSCKPSPHWQRGTHPSLWRKFKWDWQERPDTANSQLVAGSDGNCRCKVPSCKPSSHWRRGTHSPTGENGAGKKGQALPTASWQLAAAKALPTVSLQVPMMATGGAVSSHVSPVTTGKEALTPPSEGIGAGKKGQALPTASCQLPVMATAGAVSPHVSPAPTGKEAPTPPGGKSGSGKNGQALPTASWQLPALIARDGNCQQ